MAASRWPTSSQLKKKQKKKKQFLFHFLLFSSDMFLYMSRVEGKILTVVFQLLHISVARAIRLHCLDRHVSRCGYGVFGSSTHSRVTCTQCGGLGRALPETGKKQLLKRHFRHSDQESM